MYFKIKNILKKNLPHSKKKKKKKTSLLKLFVMFMF